MMQSRTTLTMNWTKKSALLYQSVEPGAKGGQKLDENEASRHN
jgi:hypothetical protein